MAAAHRNGLGAFVLIPTAEVLSPIRLSGSAASIRQQTLGDLDWRTLHKDEGEQRYLKAARENARKVKVLHEQYMKERRERPPPSESSESPDELSAALVRSELGALWRAMRPIDFVLMLESLRPTCGETDFLMRLSVGCHDNVISGPCHQPCFIEGFPRKECGEIEYPRRAYHVECTGAMQVYPEDGSAVDKAFVLKALLDTEGIQVFATPMGLAISCRAWTSMRWQNFAGSVFHFFNLCLLMYFGHNSFQGHAPQRWTIIVYLCSACVELLYRSAEMFGCCCMYGHHNLGYAIRRSFFGFWNAGYTLMHWVCLAITIHMVWFMHNHESDGSCTLEKRCWFKIHNVEFMFLVMARCAGFLMRLLSWEPLGEASLPAINAVKARKTRWYLAFLVIFWLSAAAAFYVQPIEIDTQSARICERRQTLGGFGQEMCHTFAFLDKVFNVALMGQFGLEDLENVDPELNASVGAGGSVTAKFEHGQWTQYHVGAEVWQMMVGFAINILALNVFISIVSTEYDKISGAAVANLMHFRSYFMFRDLLVQAAWEHVSKSCGSSSPQTGEHHMIYIKSAEFNKLQGQEDLLQKVLDDNRALLAENAELRRQLQSRASIF